MPRTFTKSNCLILVGLLLLPIHLAKAQSNIIYAATNNGVFKSINGGASWTSANVGLSGIAVFSLAIDPSKPSTLYAGTFGSRVFKSTDGAQSWTPSNSGFTDSIVLSIAINPANPNTIYSGTATTSFFAGSSVFKSSDGAQNWSVSNSGLPSSIIEVLEIDRSNPAVVYAGTNFAGVFKSTNGGLNWSAANSGIANSQISAIAVDSTNSTVLYAGIEGCSFNCLVPAGVFKSSNGGLSWTGVNFGITDLQVLSLAIDPGNPNILYAGTRFNGVFKTANAGGSWTAVNPALGSTVFAILHLPLVIDPVNSGTVYAGTSTGVFKSTDGGINWTGVNNGLPASTEVFALAIEKLGGGPPITDPPIISPTFAALIEQVESLDLNRGVKNSLLAKLNAAQESLERENTNAAPNQLHAFINQVRALERSDRLDPTTAGQLISAAQAIIDSI